MKFRHIDFNKGLSNNQVHSIFKDHNGFLWVGTMAGLNRYDGSNFKVYKHDPQDSTSLRDNFVLKVLEDQENYLWILSRNSSLCFYNPIKDAFTTERSLLKKNIPIPRNNISDINQDKDGRIWITNDFFGIYIYDFKTDSVVSLKNESGNQTTISSNSICSMAEDSKRNYWIVNQQGVIEKLDHKTLSVVERIPVFTKEIDQNENFRIFVDKDDDVWVYSESTSLGAKHFSSSTKKICTYSEHNGDVKITNNIVKGIVQDKNGFICIGMDHGGINLIQKETHSVTAIKNKKGDPTSLPDNSITTLYYDNSGISWIGMYKSGIAYSHPDFFKFKHYSNNPMAPNGLEYSDINCFAEDRYGDIWIGSNGGGLFVFNPKNQSFKKFKYNAESSNNNGKDVIISLLIDSKERLWIGTYFGGLYVVDGENITHFKHNPDDHQSIANDRIWNLFEDSRGNIWIGTLGGGVDLYQPSTNGFIHYKSGAINSIGSDYIFSIEEDKQGNIWFATVYGVNILDVESQRFYLHLNNPQNEKSITNNKAFVIKCDSRGWCWIGTSDGLNLFDAATNSYRRFIKKDGLPDNTILSMEEDENGNLWISTPNGLANMQINNDGGVWDFDFTIHTYNESDGLQGKSFNERASFKTRSGEILFGGVNGFNIFNPSSIKNFKTDKKLVLLQFELFNKVVKPGDIIRGRKILEQSILTTEELNLRHNENFFSISFTALDFFHPQKLIYQYRLDGFNESWFEVDPHSRKATFTNLNYGTYKFRVRISEDGNNWSEEETTLRINILPPVWATQWAFVVYFMVILLALLSLRKIILRRERMVNQRENEKNEILRKEELNQLKIKFFTNVSHEFRTPLTLILSPLKKMIDMAMNDSQKKQLELIDRNAKRLLNLVNQLLDFRKMEVDKLTIDPSIGDIVFFIREKVESFNDYAADKNIQLQFNTEVDYNQCLFDHDKIEKIIFNLLSNAFKFTHEKGSISVDLTLEKDPENNLTKNIVIRISDTGIGIPPNKLERIFERFYQDKQGKSSIYSGSGIGLALTKEFVLLHGGKINAKSEVGKGSCFRVQIPIYTDAGLLNEQKTETEQPKNELVAINVDDDKNAAIDNNNNKPTIFLVEDNDDLRFYLKENLKNTYHTIEATNGENALKLLEKHSPELIVSDVMMPLLNGIELCDRIKKDHRYSHIPLILLTARTTDEQKLEGLLAGADDYISKPFSFEILEAKIQNIITYRRKLQATFISSKDIKPSDICVTSIDEKLFQKAIEVVDKNLGDSDFSIEKMGELMGVSRAHLYNKLMGITGKTPSEFIRIMRLKRAAQLLEKSQLTISQISYEVGYNGPRYFTKHFKQFYGETPSKYANSKKEEN